MNFNQTNRHSDFLTGAHSSTSIRMNQGLRTYLLRVYQMMGLGLLVSALTAYLGSTPNFLRLLFTVSPSGTMSYSLFGWLVIIAPFILVFMFASAVRNLNPEKAQTIFWIFSALMGFSFSSALLVFTTASIFQTFIVTAGAFGGLCLYGYTTKKDLTGLGAFMNMGLWGIIIAMIVNWFMKSPAISYAVSIIGVFVFVGLTAYDSQRIKQMYNPNDSIEVSKSKSISGALTLYLDFINLFLMLLRFLGDRK
ncbi:MAG: Bax inhibitor-1/YccA family protein [Alphaproteobacteria bacterium]|nr:Bax inhibitor-1/YccA family protein [Alphaproteobacteria bacterium]